MRIERIASARTATATRAHVPTLAPCDGTDLRDVRLLEASSTSSTGRSHARQFFEGLKWREPGAHSRSHGVTQTAVEARYVLAPKPESRCAIEDVVVHLTLRSSLPVRAPKEKPAPSTQRQFAAMLRELRLHADAHRDGALCADHSLDQRPASMPAHADCKAAQHGAAPIVAQERAHMRLRSSQLDIASQLRPRDVTTAARTVAYDGSDVPRSRIRSARELDQASW